MKSKPRPTPASEKKPGRGGARPGAGRPKKVRPVDLRALPAEFADMDIDEVRRRRDFWQAERNREAAEGKRLENARDREELVEASVAMSEMRAAGLAVRQAFESDAETSCNDLHARFGVPLMDARFWLLERDRRVLTGVADDLG